MGIKNFLDYYHPDDACFFGTGECLFRLVEMPEDIYDAVESTTGLMPGMKFPLHDFNEKGVYVHTQDIPELQEFDAEIFLAWPAIEPVGAEERKLFRMAMTNYAEYNKWLEVAGTPSWAN